VQSDPIGMDGGSNYYEYSHQNSLRYYDLLGRTPEGSPSKPPVFIDPNTGKPVVLKPVPNYPETRPTPPIPKNIGRPGRGCLSGYNICNSGCVARCGGNWVRAGLCMSVCLGFYIMCEMGSDGGESEKDMLSM